MKNMKYLILFIVTAMFSYQQAEARVLEINLEKMTRIAGTIVAGRCTDVQKGFHPEYPNVKVTFVELDLLDVIKGDAALHLKFMQFGHGIEMPHATKYKKGEEILLFLYPQSQYGLTSPVGGGQGKFPIKIDSATRKPTSVKISNYGKLLKDVEIKELDGVKRNLGLTDNESGLMSYATFRKTIQAIINQPRKEEADKR